MEIYIKDNDGNLKSYWLDKVLAEIDFDSLIETDNNSAEFTVNNGYIDLDSVDTYIEPSDIEIEFINAIKTLRSLS